MGCGWIFFFRMSHRCRRWPTVKPDSCGCCRCSLLPVRVRDLGAQEKQYSAKRRPITKSYLRSFVQLICYGFDKVQGGSGGESAAQVVEVEQQHMRNDSNFNTNHFIPSLTENKLTHISVQHVLFFFFFCCLCGFLEAANRC